MSGKRSARQRAKHGYVAERRTQPHGPGEPGDCVHCTRCGHVWPCSSAVVGIDLPGRVCLDGLTEDDCAGLLKDEFSLDRLSLTTAGLIEDSGRRRQSREGIWEIVWVSSKRGDELAAALDRDQLVNGEQPDDAWLRQVVRWLADNGPVTGSRREVAKAAAVELCASPADVERGLLWAEGLGLILPSDGHE